MKIKFAKINIKNFRGISEEQFEFDHARNTIIGRNGAGKSNVLDAITWCLFGKDMRDRTRFAVVPLTADNEESKLDPEIALTVDIDGKETEFKRVLRNGSNAEVYINDAPIKTQSEYNAAVEAIFNGIDRFKMYSNPLYFPEKDWKSQRQIFMEFFPMADSRDVLNYMNKKDANVRTNLAEQLEKMPPEQLMDKALNDRKLIEKDRDRIRAQIELLDEQLDGQQGADMSALKEERDKLRQIRRELSDAMFEWDKEKQIRDTAKFDAESNIRRFENEIEIEKHRAQREFDKELDRLQQKYAEVKNWRDALARQFVQLNTPIEDTCPRCGQALPEDQIEDQHRRTDQKKKTIAEDGISAKRQMEEIEAQIKDAEKRSAADYCDTELIDDLNKKITAEKKRIEDYKPMDTPRPTFDRDDEQRLDELDRIIARSDVYEENNNKRHELMNTERTINREYEQIEMLLLDLTDFFFYRSEMLVNAVNKEFKTISVKVLEIQKNGNPKETFEILKNGVPYNELNTAGKLSAGMELTNFIKGKLDIQSPVLIDNGERYTDVNFDSIPDQIISTVAVKGEPLAIEYCAPNELSAEKMKKLEKTS